MKTIKTLLGMLWCVAMIVVGLVVGGVVFCLMLVAIVLGVIIDIIRAIETRAMAMLRRLQEVSVGVLAWTQKDSRS